MVGTHVMKFPRILGTVMSTSSLTASAYIQLQACAAMLSRTLWKESVSSVITLDKGCHQAAERCYTEQEFQLLDKLGLKLKSAVSSQPKDSVFSSGHPFGGAWMLG